MKKLSVILSFLLLFVLFSECTKDKNDTKPTPMVSVAETDSALIAKAAALTDVYYYKGNDTVYPSSPASAHNAFFRVRFNMIAKNALTDGGKLPVGGSFPIGALIVKELQLKADGTGLRGFAIMEKSPTDPNAVDGWIWAEYGSTTTPTGISLTGKGSQCVSCHSSSDRDKVRLFSLFP